MTKRRKCGTGCRFRRRRQRAAPYNARVSATASSSASSASAPASGRFGAGLLLAGTGSVLFSGKAIVIKLAYRYGVDAETLLALRMLLAVPFFLAVLWWTSRGARPLTPKEHAKLVLLGLLGYYAASYADFLGLQYISAGLERLILFLNPTIVLVLSVLFFARRVDRRDLIALALAYGGIVLVFWHDVHAGGQVMLGASLVFVSAVTYAVYLVLAGEVVQRIGALRLTAYAMCVSSAAVCVQFALMRPLAGLAQPAPVLWLSLINAVACTVVPVFATMLAIARIGAGNASMMGMIGPVSTIVLGFLFLGEAISGWQLAGTALVLAGVFVLSRKAA